MAESRTINKTKTVLINIVVEDDTEYATYGISDSNCSKCVFNNSAIDCNGLAKRITGIDCTIHKVHFLAVDYKGDIQNEPTS